MPYRYLVPDPERFVQQLAMQYLPWGYHLYVRGKVAPEDADAHDREVIGRWELELSDAQKRRREKQRLWGRVHYIRCREDWILVGRVGAGGFLQLPYRDVRREPVYFKWYAVSVTPDGRH